MMLAWSFAARTMDEIARLVRALGKNRYVREVDHRIHFTVDEALTDLPAFAEHAARFRERVRREQGLEPASRDPSLWRPATTDEAIAALDAFWAPGPATAERCRRLLDAIARLGLPPPEHAPFACPPDEPPHPELVLLDWVLLPVEELDAERHAGALAAMEDSHDEVSPSEPLYVEGPILSAPELVRGAPNGVLADDFVVWADGPYSYADYVFRGVARAAKLVDPPVGYRDLD